MVDETHGNRKPSRGLWAVMLQCLWSPEADVRPFCGRQPSSLCHTWPFLDPKRSFFLTFYFPGPHSLCPFFFMIIVFLPVWWLMSSYVGDRLGSDRGCVRDFHSHHQEASPGLWGSARLCSAPELPYIMVSVIFCSDSSWWLSAPHCHFPGHCNVLQCLIPNLPSDTSFETHFWVILCLPHYFSLTAVSSNVERKEEKTFLFVSALCQPASWV